MQSYTHLAIGATVGAVIFPHTPVVQLACLAGATIPDTPMMVLYGLDLLSGRPPMTQQTRGWILAKNICQSVLVWNVIAALGGLYTDGIVAMSIVALGTNGALHVIIDRYTHGNPRFQEDDGWYAWPIDDWRRLGWDYRIAIGQLWPPKPPEAVVLALCIVATVAGWMLR